MIKKITQKYLNSAWVPAACTFCLFLSLPVLWNGIYYFVLTMEFLVVFYKIAVRRFEAAGLASVLFLVNLYISGFARLYL